MNLYNLLVGEITQQDLLRYYNANITYIRLPKGIDGCVFPYRGISNILVDNSLTYYKKKKTILHELAHIELNHLCQIEEFTSYKVGNYEDEADRYIKFLLDKNIKD